MPRRFDQLRRVLNVGGGASRDVPPHFAGWRVENLDIDPNVRPDIVCDAKQLRTLEARTHDAVYCSHMLEHFYRHEVPAVLDGFQHVLRADGFVQLAVPDMGALIKTVAANGGEIDKTWYTTGQGIPISFHDVMFGWAAQVEKGNLYYCHKTAFTEKSLGRELRRAGFAVVLTASDGFNVHAFAFNRKPTAARRAALGI